MSRAGDRKRIELFEDFLRKFDTFIGSGAIHTKFNTPETAKRFQQSRDDIVEARNRLGKFG